MYPAIFPTLAATAAVTAVFGTAPVRIYPHGEAPQGVTLPYATHQLAGGFPANYLATRADADSATIQVNVYGATSAVCLTGAQVIREALESTCYITGLNNTGRDPDTKHYVYSFDLEFITPR